MRESNWQTWLFAVLILAAYTIASTIEYHDYIRSGIMP